MTGNMENNRRRLSLKDIIICVNELPKKWLSLLAIVSLAIAGCDGGGSRTNTNNVSNEVPVPMAVPEAPTPAPNDPQIVILGFNPAATPEAPGNGHLLVTPQYEEIVPTPQPSE